MNHSRNLVLKFLLNAILLAVLLPALGEASLAAIALAAAGLAIALYVAGDLLVLAYYGSAWTALADAGLAYLTLWGLVLLLPGLSLSASRLAIPALAIAGLEYVFHRFLRGEKPVDTINHPPENPG